MADSWWNTFYSIRRNLNIVNTSTYPIPAGNPIYAILDFTKLNSLNKIRDDFDDVEVLFWDYALATPSWTVLARDITFDALTGELIIVFNTVYEISTQDISNYYIYITNPSLREQDERPVYDSAIYAQIATPENGGIMFSRPNEDWLSGKSLETNARAAFTFYGTSATVVFEKGNDKGIVEMSIDGGEPTFLDTYSNTVSEYLETLDLDVSKHYVRFRVTGDKNPSSSGSEVKLIRIEYSKYFNATLDIEEIYSVNDPFTMIVGV